MFARNSEKIKNERDGAKRGRKIVLDAFGVSLSLTVGHRMLNPLI